MSNLVKHYPVNHRGRTFVVGDLHGCLQQFLALLDRIGFDEDHDIMYAVGDLCDRGPNSPGCLDLLHKPWFRCVAGNHDLLVMWSTEDPGFDWKNWIKNGGGWAYAYDHGKMYEWASLIRALPTVIVVGAGTDQRFNVFHAEFFGTDADLDALANRRTSPPSLQWGRDMFKGRVSHLMQKGLSRSFVGHSIVEQVASLGAQVYLDTGAFIAHREPQEERGEEWVHHGLTIVEPYTGQLWRSELTD